MNTLAAHRASLQDLLTTAGFQVTQHVPERLMPPLVAIAAGEPYLEGGEAFGTFTARFRLFLITATGTNEAEVASLDRMITTAIITLHGSQNWGVERVNQPAMISQSNATYLYAEVDVIATSHLQDGDG